LSADLGATVLCIGVSCQDDLSFLAGGFKEIAGKIDRLGDREVFRFFSRKESDRERKKKKEREKVGW
jgi:hypothetical protein